VLVIRNEAILSPAEGGALQADDYVYMLAPPERAYRLDRLFAAETASDVGLLGEFPLDADTPLSLLAALYGVSVVEADRERSVADLFADRFEGQPQTGDRLPFGDAMLVVRQTDEDRVRRVGLVLDASAGSLVAASLRPRRIGRLIQLLRRYRPGKP
jgi:cell volume regulation protein A